MNSSRSLQLWILPFIILLAALAFGTSCKSKKSETRILNVDEVVEAPEKYTGSMAVSGTVVSLDKPSSTFGLGCEDACVMLPVKCPGQLPDSGKSVVVYGKVKKVDADRYIFAANRVTVK